MNEVEAVARAVAPLMEGGREFARKVIKPAAQANGVELYK